LTRIVWRLISVMMTSFVESATTVSKHRVVPVSY
jgi:hypothetical protein